MQKKISDLFVFGAIILIGYVIFTLGPVARVQLPPKIIHALSDDQIFVEGHWREISTKKYKSIPKVNATKIFCNRYFLNCNEYAAHLVTQKDNSYAPYPGFLFVDITNTNVLSNVT